MDYWTPFCSACLCPVSLNSATHTQAHPAPCPPDPSTPSTQTKHTVSHPHPSRPYIPQPDRHRHHNTPANSCMSPSKRVPLSAPHPPLPSCPLTHAHSGKGLAPPWHSRVPTPSPMDMHVYTHTHKSHANSLLRPVPPTALAPARTGQDSSPSACPSVCPSAGEDTVTAMLSVPGCLPCSGTHGSWLCSFPPFGDRSFWNQCPGQPACSPAAGAASPCHGLASHRHV